MSTKLTIDEAVLEVTGVTAAPVKTVWIYGKAGWCYDGRMEFTPETRPDRRGPSPVMVTLMTSLINRYRDGESAMFLVEVPRSMAGVLGLMPFILDADAVERKMRNCTAF